MKNKKRFIAIVFVSLVLTSLIATAVFLMSRLVINKIESESEETNLEHHIIVLGNYENQLFLKQLCEGAQKRALQYNALVEYRVPESSAQEVTLQSLFDYASYVNADGIIAYVSSTSEDINSVTTVDGEEIPIVTTGVYASNIQQISYIGTSYWELGHLICEEVSNMLEDSGIVYFICSDYSSNPNFSNLTASLQSSLLRHPDIQYSIEQTISEDQLKQIVTHTNKKTLFVCLTEDDTIQFSLLFAEYKLNLNKQFELIGFGSNESCQFYLSKGIISELISLDPKRIGEVAITELFEYKRTGYANNYMAADIKIMRPENE